MTKHVKNQKGFIDLAVATFLFGLSLATALFAEGVVKVPEKAKQVNQGVSSTLPVNGGGGEVSTETK